MSAVTLSSTPELIAEYAKPDQDIFGNPIKVGDMVRSFDLAALLSDGRIYGMETANRSGVRVDYSEGRVQAIGEVFLDGCPRYTIQITKEYYGADGVDASDVCYGKGHFVHPPLNGTPKSTGGVTFGVVLIG
jgi:hypothetical protein